MSTEPAATADRLAEARPEGQVRLEPGLVEILAHRVEAVAREDQEVAAALAEGERYVKAIDAGCPPQFHPGVPPEQAALLGVLREFLGLDRAASLGVGPDADLRHIQILRFAGCPLVPVND